MTHKIADAKRLVIKIGSSLLLDHVTGAIHHEWLKSLIADVVVCWQRGQQIIIVSSGAIFLGRRQLKFKSRILQLEEKQAAAAVGQIKLAHAYQDMLVEHGMTAAQILLTIDDSENRKRYLNAKNTLEALLNLRAIPVINENDTVATPKTRFGDNDRLAARVAQMVSADCLVLLSDVDGLYSANPSLDAHAQLIPEVKELTADILAMGGDTSTEFGSGGMATKLAAAKIALASGCKMVIAAGQPLHPLTRIDQTTQRTWFIPSTTPTSARKNWLAQHLMPKGFIMIDQGAVAALLAGKSLLSVGVNACEGEFHQGDPVCILDSNKIEIARGLINYNAHETKKILGKKSTEIANILGYRGYEEIIHRDDLVLTGTKTCANKS